MQLLLISYHVGLRFATPFDQTHVSGCWVSHGNGSDYRFVQLRRHKFKHIKNAKVAYFHKLYRSTIADRQIQGVKVQIANTTILTTGL